MEWTQTELVSAALADPHTAPMTLEQIISQEIRGFRASPQYRKMHQAEEYYCNRSDVQRKTSEFDRRSNTRLEHPIYRKLVDQKARYLLSRPWSVDTTSNGYGQELEAIFSAGFRRKMKHMGREAVKCGVAWLQPYLDPQGGLQFLPIPPRELVPLWRDAQRSELSGFIRCYDEEVYLGRSRTRVSRAEYWFEGGVRRFFCSDSSGEYRADRRYGEEHNEWTEPHFTLGEKGFNWAQVPLVWLRYNQEELPLCHFVRELIDDYNWQTSVTADVLRDVAKFIFVLRNYGGTDLDEFVSDLRSAMAVKVEGDGGVETLQANVDISAVLAFLERERRDLFDFASAVDTRDPDLGNASGTAIGFRYMDLDADCADLADELQDTFLHLKPFMDTWLQAMGRGDFSEERFSIAFHMDLPVNETDIIQNVCASVGIVSRRTLLGNHPWVKDAAMELAALEEEEKGGEP